MYRFVIALLLVVAATVGASALVPNPSNWKDPSGSFMTINSVPCTGCFGGVFANHVAGFKCENTLINPTPYTVIGKTTGSKIAFKVVWDNGTVNCHATTVWTGIFNADVMKTRWILSGPGIKPIKGTDEFRRTP
jgi:hypothetical protein